jgi:hypothetical protein
MSSALSWMLGDKLSRKCRMYGKERLAIELNLKRSLLRSEKNIIFVTPTIIKLVEFLYLLVFRLENTTIDISQ